MQRALRERDALVAHALAVAQPGGGIVGRLEALERERCALQSELAVLTADRAHQEESRVLTRRQALDRTQTTQLLVGLFGVLPAGGVLVLGLLGMLFMAPLELIGLYFTEGRDLGRYMGWPAITAGLGGATFLLSLVWIMFLWLKAGQTDDLERDATRRVKVRLEQVLTELKLVRDDVDVDIQRLLPPDAPNVDVVALWLQRLGELKPGRLPPPNGLSRGIGTDRLFEALGRTLPRGVIALRKVQVAPGLCIDLILIGHARVWLLHCNATAGTLRQVNGAWAVNPVGTARTEHATHIPDLVGHMEEAQRSVVVTLNRAFRQKRLQGSIIVQSGIVFTHPETRLLGIGVTPISYGDVTWWADRLARDLGAARENRWPPDLLGFRIADSLLDAQATMGWVRPYPSPGVVSSIFEEQWVALENWSGVIARSA